MSDLNQNLLDQIVTRLKNVPSWNIYAIDEAKDSSAPWYEVTGMVAKELVISEALLEEQVASIPAQIQFWGRLESQARRVWEMTDRKYRQWRDTLVMGLLEPPADPVKAKDWKKPTEKTLEAAYRADAQYPIWQKEVERAEEAFNATHAVLEGWRAKMEMMKLAVFRRREDSAPRMGV